MRFENQVAVITGAAGVIGASAARRLLAEGAQVALLDHNTHTLEALVDTLGKTPRARAWPVDVTNPAAMRDTAEQVARHFGLIDIFLNNAGIEGATAPIEDYPDEMFASVQAVNVNGVFLGMKYFALKIRDGGSVVITSSVAGLGATPAFVGYVTSKHAVIGIMRAAALDLAPRKIRVNTVHPAMVESAMMARIEASTNGTPEAVHDAFVSRIPLGRYITPDEVVDAMLFLAGSESRMITGAQLTVDGGFTL